ncbi:MAG: nucleoside triphosphate pyrophosphohydrolase [Bacteroidota bacterium]
MASTLYKKLIRDHIPALIQSQGSGIPSFFSLDERGFRVAVKKKLIEEAKEVFEARTKQGIIEELGDVLEVIDALIEAFDISLQEVKTSQQAKRETRGGFEKRLFLLSVETES